MATPNKDTPAYPQPDQVLKQIGCCPTEACGFTKNELVLLEFAKVLVTKWDKRDLTLNSGASHDIMTQAKVLTREYFRHIGA